MNINNKFTLLFRNSDHYIKMMKEKKQDFKNPEKKLKVSILNNNEDFIKELRKY